MMVLVHCMKCHTTTVAKERKTECECGVSGCVLHDGALQYWGDTALLSVQDSVLLQGVRAASRAGSGSFVGTVSFDLPGAKRVPYPMPY